MKGSPIRRFTPLNILHVLRLVRISLLLVNTQSFSWHLLSPSNSNSFHPRQRLHQTQRQSRHRCIIDDVWLRSLATSLVSSALDVVQLQYMEIAATRQQQQQQQQQQQHQHHPVIFLHGLLGNKKNFISLGTALASQLETPRRILAVDLRNHGDNSHDWRDTMGHDEMAMDVVALLDRLQFQKVIVVGHSMGGKVAQAMALLYPERVAGLIVLDMAPVSYIHHANNNNNNNNNNDSNCKGGGAAAEYDSNWKTIRDILQVLTSVPLEPGMAKRDVDVFLRPHISDPAIRAFCLTNLEVVTSTTTQSEATTTTTQPRWKIPLSKIAQQLDRLADFDLQSASASTSSLVYEGDAFFITGGQSKFVRSVHLPTIQQYFPNHMVSTIRGAGHWVHAEAPDETIALIKRYLDRSMTITTTTT